MSNRGAIQKVVACGYFCAGQTSSGLHLLIRQSRKVMSGETAAFIHLAKSFGGCCDDEEYTGIIIKS